jgi:hypothetical protein
MAFISWKGLRCLRRRLISRPVSGPALPPVLTRCDAVQCACYASTCQALARPASAGTGIQALPTQKHVVEGERTAPGRDVQPISQQALAGSEVLREQAALVQAIPIGKQASVSSPSFTRTLIASVRPPDSACRPPTRAVAGRKWWLWQTPLITANLPKVMLCGERVQVEAALT